MTNNINGATVLQTIISNPQTDLERETAESFQRYVGTAQALLMNISLGALFGFDEVDLSDNVFVDYLADYVSNMTIDNEKDGSKQLEEEYQLTTAEGSAKFNADSFTAKEAGDKALITNILERCGLEFNDDSITKIKIAFEATKQYTEGSPAFLNTFGSAEELCQKFIDFEQKFNERLESRKSKSNN